MNVFEWAKKIADRPKKDLLQEYDDTFQALASHRELLKRVKTQKLCQERMEMITHLERRLQLIESLGKEAA